MSKPTLKPCPFCGAAAQLSYGLDREVCNVRCVHWGAGCTGAGANCGTSEEAIDAWNRRAERFGQAEPVAPKPWPVFDAECDAADQLMALLGLNPDQCRTDGGAINMARVRTFLAEKAAPQPDRVAELERENFALAAGQCIELNGLLGDEFGHQYCAIKKERDALAKHIAELERDLWNSGMSWKAEHEMRSEAEAQRDALAEEVERLRKDAGRLDRLQAMADEGVVSICFELDGGYHVTLDSINGSAPAAREVNSVRDGIDYHIALAARADVSKTEGGE